MHDDLKAQIKKRLNNYTNIREELDQLEDQIARMGARLRAPKAQVLDGMPHSSGEGHTLADAVADYLHLLDEIYPAKLYELRQELAVLETVIEGLEPIERKLARCRYIEGKSWEAVCVDMGYSWRQTHRIHSKMLDKLVAVELEKMTA